VTWISGPPTAQKARRACARGIFAAREMWTRNWRSTTLGVDRRGRARPRTHRSIPPGGNDLHHDQTGRAVHAHRKAAGVLRSSVKLRQRGRTYSRGPAERGFWQAWLKLATSEDKRQEKRRRNSMDPRAGRYGRSRRGRPTGRRARRVRSRSFIRWGNGKNGKNPDGTGIRQRKQSEASDNLPRIDTHDAARWLRRA